MSLGGIRQLGFVVSNIEETAHQWISNFGAGPFFVLRDMTFSGWRYQGELQDIQLDIAFGQCGDMMAEFIYPKGDWPNVYGDQRSGDACALHHHGYLVQDMGAAELRLGREAVASAQFTDSAELRYYDLRHSLGFFVEFITDCEETRAFFDRTREAASVWDGVTEPLRDWG